MTYSSVCMSTLGRSAASNFAPISISRAKMLSNAITEDRLQHLEYGAAYLAHPDRFVRRPPKPLPLPSEVWINKPAKTDLRTEENSH
jgi:hypothetical protein